MSTADDGVNASDGHRVWIDEQGYLRLDDEYGVTGQGDATRRKVEARRGEQARRSRGAHHADADRDGRITTKAPRAGRPCRKCGTPVIRRSHDGPTRTHQRQWFKWWFWCPSCRTVYFDEAARVIVAKAKGAGADQADRATTTALAGVLTETVGLRPRMTGCRRAGLETALSEVCRASAARPAQIERSANDVREVVARLLERVRTLS